MFFYVSALVVISVWLAFAVLLLARVRGAPSPAVLMVLVPAIASFLTFFTALLVGHPMVVATAMLVMPFLVAVVLQRRVGRVPARTFRRDAKDLRDITLFVVGLGAFAVGALFLYSGPQEFTTTASARFAGFSTDNSLPHLFAEGVRHGDVPTPLAGDWNSADRPPLQVGFVLLTEPLIRPLRGYHSDGGDGIAGLIFQLLWVPAAWAMAKALSRSRLIAFVATAACAFTGSVLNNTIYVWPKLAAAALMLVAFTMIVETSPSSDDELATGRRRGFVLAGVAIGLATLSHGSAVFAVLGLLPCIVLVLWRDTGRAGSPRIGPMIKSVLALGCTALLLYIPWVLYGSITGERGDRLLKMHLAGQPLPTDDSIFKALSDAYQHLSLGQWWDGRITNLQTLGPRLFGSESGVHTVVQTFRTNEAYRVAGALAWACLWLIGCVVALALGKRRHVDVVSRRRLRLAVLWTIASLVVWVLVIFTPGDTTLNAGSLTLVIVPMLLVSVVLMTWNSRVAWTVLVIQGVLFTALAIPPGLPFTSLPINGSALVVFIAGCVLVAGVLASVARRASRHPRPRATAPEVAVPG